MYKLGKLFYILINEKGEIFGPNGHIKMFDSVDSAYDYLAGIDRQYKVAPARINHATGVQVESCHKAVSLRSKIGRGVDVRRSL